MVKNNFTKAYWFWHWGEGFQTVLFTWYITFEAQLSATEIGFYQALTLSPFLLVAIIGGALTDRFGATIIFVKSTAAFGVVLIAYGVTDANLGFVGMFFFIYCVIVGILSAISNPAIDTFIPDFSERSVQANGLYAANAHNGAKLTGNISALAVPLLHAIGGFVLNAILMLISARFLVLHGREVSKKLTRRLPLAANRSASYMPVLAHLRKAPESLDILLSSALLGLFMVPTGYVILPLFLRENFPAFGDFTAALNMSSWIGAIVATAFLHRMSVSITRPGIISVLLWMSFGTLLLLLTVSTSFPMMCGFVLFLGMSKAGKALVYGRMINNCPQTHRGVLVAIDQTAFWGLSTVGTLAVGVIIDLSGLTTAIIITACGFNFGICLLAFRGNLLRIRSL
jgi:MFS family permease|tara:strand:- start:142 stop:1335 length:1194 start_codon:yes stop_codon:yes gene_type:complete